MNKKLHSMYLYFREYGLLCLTVKILSELFPYRDQESGLRYRILQHKHRVFTEYMAGYYRKNAVDRDSCTGEKKHRGYIWTAWLQGETNAPEVIRMNLASVRKNAGDHPVSVISDDNLDLFLNVPQKIKIKYQNGVISRAHYTDIIRTMLLAEYGGLWLDASLFLYHRIDEAAFSSPFYSVGFYADRSRFVSEHRWIVAVLGGAANSRYLASISEMLTSYWTEHNVPLDYFVFDYLIAALYRNDPSFRKIVDELPRMPFYPYELLKIINEPYDPDKLDEKLGDGQVSCLSYRNAYRKETEKGELTNYGFLYRKMMGHQPEQDGSGYSEQ